MVAIKFITMLALLFSAALAAPKHLQVIDITEDFLPITLTRQEDAEYALNSSTSGFGKLTEVGIRVTRGASARLIFDITVDGVSADRLSESDSEFVSVLSESEKETYNRVKSEYSGGLRIPLFSFLGANFNARTSRESMDRARSLQTNYDEKSRAASKVLEDVTDSRVRIEGELLATGISFIPTTANAFIKSARVTLNDGSTLRVVSSDPNDVVAAESDGDVLPDSDKNINIFDEF